MKHYNRVVVALILFLSIQYVSYSNDSLRLQTNLKYQDSSNENEVEYLSTVLKYKFDSTNTLQFKHNIGLGIGNTTGNGFSYRYQPNKFQFQVNVGGRKDLSSNEFSCGLTVFYNLFSSRNFNLFAYQANGYKYSFEKSSYNYSTNKYSSKEVQGLNHGLGLGIELLPFQRMGFTAMFGYGALNNFEEIHFVGESGIYFKF